jgi:hypothetical protein
LERVLLLLLGGHHHRFSSVRQVAFRHCSCRVSCSPLRRCSLLPTELHL